MLAIQGIRIKSMTITREDDTQAVVRSEYELISTSGKVLAKQTLTSKSSYGETTFMPSGDTLKLFADASKSYVKDVEDMLGITESK